MHLVGVEAEGMMACPCAQEMVRAHARERLTESGIDAAMADRVLDLVPLATHNQRGRGRLLVGAAAWRAEDLVIGRGRRGIERRLRVRFRVTILQDEDGVFVAEVPVLPGCLSQGRTRSEAIENIKEAITAYLESLNAHSEPIPSPISEEIVEVVL